ncbi:membrane lipoprotein lipid attachment site-containing protein [Metabacillus sp. SLBN-84]
MKKILLGISMVVLLSGCGIDESQLEKMMTIMSEDKVMLEHLSSLSYDISAETDYEDDLTAAVSDSFDSLSPKEQNNYVDHMNEIALKYNGDPKDGSFFCGEDYECYIGDIEIKTENHTYTKRYSEDESMSPLLYKNDEPIYDASQKDGIPVTEAEEVTETDEEEVIEEPVEVTEDDNAPDLSTADGSDWVTLTSDEKTSLVSEALTNIRSHGTVVNADADWFVEALDAFYGDEMTNSTLVKEAIALSGVGGGVIE